MKRARAENEAEVRDSFDSDHNLFGSDSSSGSESDDCDSECKQEHQLVAIHLTEGPITLNPRVHDKYRPILDWLRQKEPMLYYGGTCPPRYIIELIDKLVEQEKGFRGTKFKVLGGAELKQFQTKFDDIVIQEHTIYVYFETRITFPVEGGLESLSGYAANLQKIVDDDEIGLLKYANVYISGLSDSSEDAEMKYYDAVHELNKRIHDVTKLINALSRVHQDYFNLMKPLSDSLSHEHSLVGDIRLKERRD